MMFFFLWQTKEEGKALLRTIASIRGQQENPEGTMDAMDVTNCSIPPETEAVDMIPPDTI